ncbi:unnamed protein product [Closterium sp. Naga37s-1]|nr:unnamed protein product [Closterium sp. Naga37s-1]
MEESTFMILVRPSTVVCSTRREKCAHTPLARYKRLPNPPSTLVASAARRATTLKQVALSCLVTCDAPLRLIRLLPTSPPCLLPSSRSPPLPSRPFRSTCPSLSAGWRVRSGQARGDRSCAAPHQGHAPPRGEMIGHAGRAMAGSAEMVRELVAGGESVLLMGARGVEKSRVLPPSRRSRSHPAVSSPSLPAFTSPIHLTVTQSHTAISSSLLPLLPVVASPSSPPSPLPPPHRRRSILPAVAAPSSPPSPPPPPRRPLSLHAVASPSSPPPPLPPPRRRLSLLPAVASSSSPPSPPATGARAQA